LTHGAEVWQIPTREKNKIISTEMDVLRRAARKSRMEITKNERIKQTMGVELKPNVTEITETERYSGVATSEGCQRKEHEH
jgi:hypothetical protein